MTYSKKFENRINKLGLYGKDVRVRYCGRKYVVDDPETFEIFEIFKNFDEIDNYLVTKEFEQIEKEADEILIEEVEEDIRKLKKKKKTIVQTNVSGSNPDFPYNPQHFKIQGTTFTFREDSQLRMEEKLLDQRKADAEKIKIQVEEWMNTIPQRMQRIIRYKIFKGMNWQQVAKKMGRDATEESVRKEFERFFVKK